MTTKSIQYSMCDLGAKLTDCDAWKAFAIIPDHYFFEMHFGRIKTYVIIRPKIWPKVADRLTQHGYELERV